MQYYRFESVRSPKYCEIDGVGDAEGRGLQGLFPRDHAIELGYTPAEDVDHGWTTIYRKGALPDVISEPSFYMLISGRTKAIIDEFPGAKLLSSIPTTILDKQKNEVAEYFFIYTRNRVPEPLDFDLSEFEYRSVAHPDTPTSVRKYVFAPERIPSMDIFQTDRFIDWIVTERVKRRFDENKITGCRFVPIWSGPSPLDE